MQLELAYLEIGNKNWILAPVRYANWLIYGARLNFLNSALIDIMIKTIRAIKSNCKSLLIAEENFVIKEQSEPKVINIHIHSSWVSRRSFR